MTTIEELERRMFAEPNNPQHPLDLAREYHRAGQYDRALPLYEASLRLKAHPVVSFNMAVCWEQLGRVQRAEALLDPLAGDLAGMPAFFAVLGRIKAKLQKYDEAVAVLERALRMEETVEGYYNHGFALDELGQAEKAERSYRAALALDPNHAQALNNLGLMCLNTGRPGEAVPLLSRATALEPGNFITHINLALAHAELQQIPQAEEVMRRLPALFPDDPSVPFTIAKFYKYNLEQAAASVPHFAVAVERAPQRHQPEVLGEFAEVLFATGRPAEAFAALERALSIDPNDGDNLGRMAFGLLRSRQFEAARGHFERALALAPQNGMALYGLCAVSIHLGDGAGARRWYQAMVALQFPKAEELREAVARMG
jgi:tetratricopeptide (TPR) repeat protein